MIRRLLWALVSLCAALSLGIVTGFIAPDEKVNAFWILTAAVCIYAIAYRFYSAFLSAKVLALDGNRTTTATRLNDGVDYHPTNKWVLFGHHFAAISGAGPIIGPTLAAQFGYLPGFLWLLIGVTLGGAVHDMIILAASVRRNGRSLAQIVKDEIGPAAGICIALAILFNIVVAVSGSGLAVVNALAHSPWGTFTVALTIPIAMLMGVYLHSFRPGKVQEVSIIGAVLLLLAVYIGRHVPGSFLSPFFDFSKNELIILLGVLCFFSSALPVWLLLLPRDYVSAYLKIGTFVLLAAGICVTLPSLQMPAVTVFASGGGPIIPGKLFPFLFITIACGAVSGFHGLIASGTTPKMVKSENDIRLIGFGAMLTESIVAVMSLIAACILVPGDYFSINTTLSDGALAQAGFHSGKIAEVSAAIGTEVKSRPGGAVSLAVGMSTILSNVFGKQSMAYWYNFALMFQAIFILTLVDAGTRVGRFFLQEIGGYIYKPIAARRNKLNIFITSFIIVYLWVYLLFTGNISTIWPMFGVANQILAGVGFAVGTTLLIKSGKKRYAWTTFVPMCFMFTSTFFASWKLVNIFIDKASKAASSSEALNLRIDAILVSSMALLAVIILVDMAYKWYGYLSGSRETSTSELVEYSS